MPNFPSLTRSWARTPKRVARILSCAVGEPPLWTWPRTVTLVSKPVLSSISLPRKCPMPPSLTCPNSSRSSVCFTTPLAFFESSLAPSATTMMEKFLPLACLALMASETSSRSKGFSGIRMTSPPPAIPECTAIQPACRPMTSTTITRSWDSAVVCRRSMASVAMDTAVSNPKVTSVPERSLSMVLGTPTTGSLCSLKSLWATPSVSSPPIAIRASKPRRLKVATTFSPPSSSLKGFVLDVCRIVPPRWISPETARRVSSSCCPVIIPFHPCRIPRMLSPSWMPFLVMARMTALSPGQSPPPVKIPILMTLPSVKCQ